jgi:hypothetical protein
MGRFEQPPAPPNEKEADPGYHNSESEGSQPHRHDHSQTDDRSYEAQPQGRVEQCEADHHLS